MFDRERFYIWDVDLTNGFHHIHEQIDIFRRTCKNRFHDMNGKVRFCIVVRLFYYWYLLEEDVM